jgi:hypothetical protein
MQDGVQGGRGRMDENGTHLLLDMTMQGLRCGDRHGYASRMMHLYAVCAKKILPADEQRRA